MPKVPIIKTEILGYGESNEDTMRSITPRELTDSWSARWRSEFWKNI
jgi:hypothetical protein